MTKKKEIVWQTNIFYNDSFFQLEFCPIIIQQIEVPNINFCRCNCWNSSFYGWKIYIKIPSYIFSQRSLKPAALFSFFFFFSSCIYLKKAKISFRCLLLRIKNVYDWILWCFEFFLPQCQITLKSILKNFLLENSWQICKLIIYASFF